MFLPIFNQMIILFSFIVIGYLLFKCKILPQNSDVVLSKIENYLFLPALVLGTYVEKCTIATLVSAWKPLAFACALLVVVLPLSYLLAKWIYRDDYLRKIAQYGLTISNISFMGNAIMLAVFPSVFFEYTIFILPIGFLSYLWGVPALLLGREDGEKRKTGEIIKNLLNPTVLAMLLGIIIGILGWKLPNPLISVLNGAGACMAPTAMILTGVIIGKSYLRTSLLQWRVYVISIIRMLVYPLVYIGIVMWIPIGSLFTENMLICGMMFMCLSMGLNAVVIPTAYGRDTTEATSMALVTSLLSIGTIPLVFWLFQILVL